MKTRHAFLTQILLLAIAGPLCAEEHPSTGDPQLDAQIAAARTLQEELAERWSRRAELPPDDQFDLAIAALRTAPEDAADIADTDIGKQTAAEARAFLLAHRAAAKPKLLAFLREDHPFALGDWRMCQVAALLGEFGDRDMVAPLVEKVLAGGPNDYAPSFAARGLAKLNDADVPVQLLRAYPHEEPFVQDTMLGVIAQAPSREFVRQLQEWHRVALAYKSQTHMLEWALGSCRDAGGREYQFAGANPALRKLIDERIAARRRARFADKSEFGILLQLAVADESVQVGDKPQFKLKLVNTNDKQVKLMRSRDGSDVGWVMPKIFVEAWGPDHRPMNVSIGRCGNVNPLQASDVVTVEPGERFDPLTGGFGHQFLASFPVKAPGVYHVHVVYDTTRIMGDGTDKSEVLSDVLPVRLVSNMVTLNVEAPED